jgi:hypothetical protein
MKTTVRFAMVMTLLIVAAGAFGQEGAKGTRLTARADKTINGFKSELRGDYRESGTPTQLTAELEQINIPIGTKVAFCTVKNGFSTLLGVASVTTVGGELTASVELHVTDGDIVPNIDAGNLLQGRQRTTAPFIKSPTCGSVLLISAPFQR